MKRTAKSFPVYLDYSKAVNKLSDEDAGKLFKALLEYADSGQEPQLEGSLYAVFAIMQNQLDRDTEKYEQKCARLRENGAKGGRPSRSTEPDGNQNKPSGFSSQPKKAETDTATETETATENDSDNGKPADKPLKPIRHKYGEYKNVLLTEEELSKLQSEIPCWQAMIERLSSYMESSGKKYKSHLATMRNWYRKDQSKTNSKNLMPDYGGEENWSL